MNRLTVVEKLIVSLFLVLLPSCAWLQRAPQPPTHQPPTQAIPHYPLLAPATYGGSFSAQSLLEGEARGQHFQLHTYLEIDADQIQVLGFTPWQTRAFILRYDGVKLDFENFTNRDMPFPPALILSDIQQVLWPNLANQDSWRVVDAPQDRERRIYFQDQLMTRIQYNKGFQSRDDVELSNIPFDYHLRIRNLPP